MLTKFNKDPIASTFGLLKRSSFSDPLYSYVSNIIAKILAMI